MLKFQINANYPSPWNVPLPAKRVLRVLGLSQGPTPPEGTNFPESPGIYYRMLRAATQGATVVWDRNRG